MTRITPLTILIAILAGAGSGLAPAGEIRFIATPAPQTDSQKRAVLSSASAVVDGAQVPLNFQTLLRSGERGSADGAQVHFGLLMDSKGQPLVAEDGSLSISNDNDFSSLISGKDNKLYMVSHFEARPGAIYLTELDQNIQTGALSAVRTRPLDLSAMHGGWVHCAGSVTPWGAHLGSEEYEPDAKRWAQGLIEEKDAAMAAYFGATPAEAGSAVNPYHYGYPIEVEVSNFADTKVSKHYAMGRKANELGYVMPDNRTVYLSDDGTNTGLFRFVAERAGDLSAGALWAACWAQTSAQGAGAAFLDWIYLGAATDEQVHEWASRYAFVDIFDQAEPMQSHGNGRGACPAGYVSINAGHLDGDHQCLRLRDIDQNGAIDETDANIAAHLETRRWAAMRGATTEFRKMEGITYDPDKNLLYLAMSEIDRGMLDFSQTGTSAPVGRYDTGGPNQIRLTQGNLCGAVYALRLDGNNTAVAITPLLAGIPMTTKFGAAANSPVYDGNNECDINGLANPDNITYMPGYDTLIIGEDSGRGHQNDAIWAFNTNTRELTRILTTPYGAETTSPYFYPDIHGFAYLMSVIQHPYGESDQDKLEEPGQAAAYTGYFVFPKMIDGNAHY